jgi:uncharacterized repeat protein (TIGR01451 family)
MVRSFFLQLILVISCVQSVWAASGDILFLDNFERSNPGSVGNGWTVTAAAGACDGALPSVKAATYPSATITIAGSQKVAVNGITVSGAQIMKAVYAGSASPNTVASSIATQINACTASASGNCTVSGYSAASNNSGVVTITGPSSTTGTPVVSLGAVSGTGTTETFAVSAFSAYSPGGTTYNASTNTGCAGIDADVPPWNSSTLPLAPRANTNSKTMFTRWATVTVDSPVVNLAGKPAAQVTFWVRRGSDCFSEWPGNNQTGCNGTLSAFSTLLGEEFQVQYKNSSGTWVVLAQYPTDAIPGEIFRPVIDLPADALWGGFQLRFRQPAGSGFNSTSGGASGVRGYDYWHLDDVRVTELAATSYSGAYCDTFEGDLSRWTFNGTGNAAIGSKYFQNGAHNLDIRWGPVTVTSKPTDLTGATGKISYWIKRGVGNVTTAPNATGSDQPETGKDLVVEYLTTTAGVWKALVPSNSFTGGGTGGQVWCPAAGTNCATATPNLTSISIPADANLTAFQLRFRLLGGAGYDQDYWHVDDICMGTVITGTDLSLSLTPSGTTTLAPGATSNITFTVTNLGPNVEPGAITITDTLPAGLSFVSSGSWSSGTWPSGLTGCTTVGQTLTCTRVGSLTVGSSVNLSITIQANASASGSGLTNTATVGGQSIDSSLSNNTASNSYSLSPAIFEAYEASTSAAAIAGRIYTKLAGTPFTLKVIAINNGAINAAYNKAVTVDLIDASSSCVTGTTALTGVTVTPASPYTYVAASDMGGHSFSFTSTKAYRNVKVRVRDNSAIDCSSDIFSIRPSGITIASDSANADSTGASTNGSPRLVAGAVFSLTATASALGYDGTPLINSNLVLAHVGAISAGALSGDFGAAPASTSVASGAAFKYSEVGYFRLGINGIYDESFTAVDQSGDCVPGFSNVLDANGQYGCNFGNTGESSFFGRFIPDRFDTVVTQACVTGAFTYSGQPFSTKVTARNVKGDTTVNYDKSVNFSKVTTLSSAGSVVNFSNNYLVSTDFTSGVGINSAMTYTFPIATTSPTIKTIRAQDTDSVVSNAVEGMVAIRSGKIKMLNGYGSELLALPITFMAQYWNGNFFVTNTADSCTVIPMSNFTMSNYQKNLIAGKTQISPTGNVKLLAGLLPGPGMILSPPGLAYPGSTDLTFNLGSQSWFGSNPFARATFGIYKSPLIYLRENY